MLTRAMNRLTRASGEIGAMLRAVLGVPNYDRYVAHMRRCHPGDTPLARAAFEQQRLHERYSKPGSKCC